MLIIIFKQYQLSLNFTYRKSSFCGHVVERSNHKLQRSLTPQHDDQKSLFNIWGKLGPVTFPNGHSNRLTLKIEEVTIIIIILERCVFNKTG